MNVKININKIDYELSSKFENLKIEEKSSIKFGKYFQIELGDEKKLKVILPYKNLDSNNILMEWFYYSNPLNESSDLIPRSCSIQDMSMHIEDIFSNNRFSEDYKNYLTK